MKLTTVLTALIALGVALLFLYILLRSRYKKAGPDEALIVYGRRKLFGKKVRGDTGEVEGFRIVRGGGTFVMPVWEQVETLSLRMMTLEIDLRHVYTVQGIPINVKAVAQVKVSGDIQHIRRAAEGFLGVSPDNVRSTIKETVAGHLRGIIGTLTVEELYRDQKRFQDSVRDEAHKDLEGMGFEFRSFVFQEIQDDEGYLNALGQPKIQEALKNARVATAVADRDAKIEEESARQNKEQKKFSVDTEIADAEKQLSLKVADIRKLVDVANAQAVKAGEMELKVQNIRIAEQEVERQKLELNATIREKADAAKYETERTADAAQYRVEREAKAEAVRRREIGVAEADAIRARGEAEAEARRLLAEALKQYNEAGLSIEALKVLPEIAAAVSEPLARAGSATIISQGGGAGSGTGTAKLSEDVVQVLSQLNPIMQQLAGVNLSSFLQDISKLPAAVADNLSSAGRGAGGAAKGSAKSGPPAGQELG
jgi:flotillin